MKFVKRTTAPTKDNKYYGKPDPFISAGYGMFQNNGNCTDYAYCRFRELQADITASDKLPTSNAETWYKKVKQSGYYKVGNTPKVGAIAVYGKGIIGVGKDGAGHVCIVEEVYDDGSFLTSNSGFGKSLFYQKKIGANKKLSGYTLQGFIYPNVKFENEEWLEGTYILLKSKYIRTSPKVADNYVLVKNCISSVKPKLTSLKGTDKARFKVGVTVDITGFATDSKGNLWGKMKNTYICLKDSTGNQVKKV